MLDLLDRVGEPDLSGARDNLEGRFHITDWTTNPNFLAAYSAMLPGVKRRNPLVIGNLVFAGEAFVQDLKKSPSQMTGAWESGRIAGKKILTSWRWRLAGRARWIGAAVELSVLAFRLTLAVVPFLRPSPARAGMPRHHGRVAVARAIVPGGRRRRSISASVRVPRPGNSAFGRRRNVLTCRFSMAGGGGLAGIFIISFSGPVHDVRDMRPHDERPPP